MSPRGWWYIVIALYLVLVIYWIASLDPSTVCSANQPC